MAFATIAASDVDSDSPITDTLMNTIRTNFDDHETRVAANTHAGAVAVRVVEVAIQPAVSYTWETFASALVWVPAGITTLTCRLRGKINTGSSGYQVRMYIAANTTAGAGDAPTSTTTFQDVTCSIDPHANDKGDWAIVEFQIYGTDSRTFIIHKDEETVSGLQRNYEGASYWS